MAKIYFNRGKLADFEKLDIDNNTVYFIEDSNEIFLGSERFGFGKDIVVEISGKGRFVSDVLWNKQDKILTIVKGSISHKDIDTIVIQILDIFHRQLEEEFATKDEIPEIDSELSDTSTNPVQNKVVNEAIEDIRNKSRPIRYGSTEEWNSQASLIAEEGAIYVYSDYSVDSQGRNIAGIKVGDGKAYLIDMPFIDETMYEHIQDIEIHITQSERIKWNNKLNVDDDAEVVDEALVFNRN